MIKPKPLILVSNDDGISSAGIRFLEEAVAPLGDVYVVAPDQERSAASHALTIHKPLRITEKDPRHFALNGTPTDCINFALYVILPRKPDLIVSGINHGCNLADDVTYSGTVSAAFEGSILGTTSLAFSLEVPDDPSSPLQFETARHYARKIARLQLASPVETSVLLSVNIPNLPLEKVRGIRVTHLGKRLINETNIIRKEDPRGRPYYWIGMGPKDYEPDEASDLHAIDHGWVSLTPLHLDLTHYPSMSSLRKWEEQGIPEPDGNESR
ncbi:MAG: 5'/3'-nucleotidase SurE [Leptospirales bacterium]